MLQLCPESSVHEQHEDKDKHAKGGWESSAKTYSGSPQIIQSSQVLCSRLQFLKDSCHRAKVKCRNWL